MLEINQHIEMLHRSMPRLTNDRSSEGVYSTLPRGLQYQGVVNYPRNATIRSQRSVRNNIARYDSIREMEGLNRTKKIDRNNPYSDQDSSEV